MSCLPVDVVCLPVDVRFAGGFQENGFQHTPSHENTSKKSRWMLKKSVMILHQKFNTHCQTDRKVYSPVDVGLPVDVGRFAGGCGRFAGGCHGFYIHCQKNPVWALWARRPGRIGKLAGRPGQSVAAGRPAGQPRAASWLAGWPAGPGLNPRPPCDRNPAVWGGFRILPPL